MTPRDPASPSETARDGGADIWALPKTPEPSEPKTRPRGDTRIVVALDLGHGGIDTGAQYGGLDEVDLMLLMAREMKEHLILSGRYDVFLTGNEDVFLSLQGRVSKACAAGTSVFISFHSDALAKGKATGTTIYTLSEEASDEFVLELAKNHERSDLLSGVDLGLQDDLVASILIDMRGLRPSEDRKNRQTKLRRGS